MRQRYNDTLLSKILLFFNKKFLLIKKLYYTCWLNRILLNAIKVLEEQGFEKSPFTSAWYGRTSWGFCYGLTRLSNSYLEYITFYINRGDRFIGAELNIFELSPTPKSLSELNGVKGVAFFNPPASRTRMFFLNYHTRVSLVPFSEIKIIN